MKNLALTGDFLRKAPFILYATKSTGPNHSNYYNSLSSAFSGFMDLNEMIRLSENLYFGQDEELRTAEDLIALVAAENAKYFTDSILPKLKTGFRFDRSLFISQDLIPELRRLSASLRSGS